MSPQKPDPFTISDLYLAYRKAKAEAFYENTHFHALAFSEYELDIDRNLRKLHRRLSDPHRSWTKDTTWLGGYTYAPKSVDTPVVRDNERVFYRFLDPMDDWKRQYQDAGEKPLQANFRLFITPSVDFQIISALWILKVGHKYDAVLDQKRSYGNRLRRSRELEWTHGGVQRPAINTDCIGLFAPYFSAYANWRGNGLRAMRAALESGDRIVVVTMDLQRFYHRVSPKFLLRDSFLETVGVKLDVNDVSFTRNLIAAIQAWYRSTPDAADRPAGAIPVGLSASKIIANVLLAELDSNIISAVNPIYYGRYVDDVFLVVRLGESPLTGDAVMHRLADQLPSLLKYKSSLAGESGAGLRVTLKYARDSELLFTGSKQKVFNLSGSHGLDLVRQIAEQIRKHSSEHRLLPLLPATAEGMASRALLAQPSATLEADALRKADAISVRRLGLSLLLRDVENYARDLRPAAWKHRRLEFYGLVQRHVVTPVGFFDFFSYVHRVFGLMIACGDFKDAIALVRRLHDVSVLLEQTTTAGGADRERFGVCLEFHARALFQVALQASTVARFPWSRLREFIIVLRSVREFCPGIDLPPGRVWVRRLSTRLLHTDWGRRPYRDYWLHKGTRRLPNPRVPASMNVRRILHGVRAFRKEAGLGIPYWPGLVFPTRALALSELTVAAPSLVRDSKKLRSAVFAFRGARTRKWDAISVNSAEANGRPDELVVRTESDPLVRLAVPSLLTTEKQWNAALLGKPRLDIARYEKIRQITNNMMKESPPPHYVVYPECSLPIEWAKSIAYKLATKGISMIGGLEYRPTSFGVRNDAMISLSTQWPWYASSLTFIQPKCSPSHEERRLLRKAGNKSLYKPRGDELPLPVYVHGEFCFGVLLCSDLTDISHRGRFQGAVDAVFVLEWNKDVETFGVLVEGAAHDVHAYIVQVNNRQYGDSRIRTPRRLPYERDAIRVKGGLNDYYVTAAIDYRALRTFQRKRGGIQGDFKPTPIGFAMSDRRRSV